jgi:precorrin-6A/cobalt-precorrin-6A reductase
MATIMAKRILILGGTRDALELADTLSADAHFSAIYSLAGRVEHPRLPNCETRIGGFGGVSGLSTYLADNRIHAVIDATHPFAATIKQHAEQASQQQALPLLALVRPPWSAIDGDIWHEVPDLHSATALIPRLGKRIFLAIGRQEVSVFAPCTDEYLLIRAIEPPTGPLPPNCDVLFARGPFHFEDELKLLRDHAIDLVVTKNSGGTATYPKIAAARELHIPVIMVQRPRAPQVPSAATISSALTWLHHLSSTT